MEILFFGLLLTWKQCQWIMRTITCKHKIGEKIGYIWGPIQKSSLFSMFSKLAAYIYWRLISGLSNVQKNLSSSFLNNANFLGMDQITSKSCNKSSWMQANKILLTHDLPSWSIPLLFCTQFSMESNHCEIKPRFQSLYIIFLKY